jgi:rhodanese-related sulfurtransferase
VALLLRSRGVTRVRPLAGGIEAWRERGLPLHPLPPGAAYDPAAIPV